MAQELAFEPTALNREIAFKGKTPEEFAKLADVSLPTIYRALRGMDLKPRSFTRIVRKLAELPSLDVAPDLVKAS